MLSFMNLGKMGRLGNQMFQIASTIGIAKMTNTVSCFPEWEYEDFFKKKLQRILVAPQVHGEEGKSDYRDMRPAINPNINININGYFQSHLYFDHCRDEIFSQFNLKEKYYKYIFEKYPDIKQKNSIHVRRGDYLHLSDFHPIQSMDYYNNAMDYINDTEEYYVFSDDLDWCRENFKNSKFKFINEEDDIIELFIMSLSKNNIIANSSFSWWAAYLNKNTHKKIVAPKKWFSKERVESTYHDKDNYLEHRVPASWKII